jgi:septal ring factor EnvC (AmiA/AmiB activator)
MRIKRFNEATQEVDISSDRIDEILTELKETAAAIEDKNKLIESLENELDNYKSDSQKGNDQIDDSIFALQVIKKNITDSLDKIDTVVKNLQSYDDEGRKYLYTENK